MYHNVNNSKQSISKNMFVFLTFHQNSFQLILAKATRIFTHFIILYIKHPYLKMPEPQYQRL